MPRFGRFLFANLLLLAIFPGTAVMAAWPRTTPFSSPSRALIRAFLMTDHATYAAWTMHHPIHPKRINLIGVGVPTIFLYVAWHGVGKDTPLTLAIRNAVGNLELKRSAAPFAHSSGAEVLEERLPKALSGTPGFYTVTCGLGRAPAVASAFQIVSLGAGA